MALQGWGVVGGMAPLRARVARFLRCTQVTQPSRLPACSPGNQVTAAV